MKNEDLYDQITLSIIDGLKDAGKWSKPWKDLAGNMPHNAVTGRAYSGINVFLLAMLGGQYPTPGWVTYNQAKALGGSVTKGEKGTYIIFYKILEKENAQGAKEKIPLMRTYCVFNIDQCEDLDVKKLKHYTPPVSPENGVIGIAESVGAEVKYGGNSACYIPSVDQIHMPSVEAFKDFTNHEATLLHELIHWTGGAARLGRIKNHSYAEEELVAELGAAMAGAALGLPYEGLQHAEYIAHWIGRLENDHKYIFKAAAMAQKALNLLLPEENAVEEAA